MHELQTERIDKEQKTESVIENVPTMIQNSATKVPFSYERSMYGPPLLDKMKNGIEGLAFIGLSLSRHTSGTFTNKSSVSRQTQFDFDLLQDREYKYFCSTNDDGWLVGGGENGDSFKLENADSAHVEICRIGSLNPLWGGISLEFLEEIMTNGMILIPQMAILPTEVNINSDRPPEVEVRFLFEKSSIQDDDEGKVDKWFNWQLKFVHNQLFDIINNPNRFCPGAFHSTFVRKATWRNADAMINYFANCQNVVNKWRQEGPMLLEPQQSKSPNIANFGEVDVPIGEELSDPYGIYLFKDRKTILKYFKPTFLPPYDTVEKRKIIENVLSKTWNEETLSWVKHDWCN